MRINTNIFITIYKNLDNIIKNLKIKQESPDFLKKICYCNFVHSMKCNNCQINIRKQFPHQDVYCIILPNNPV